MTENTRPKDPNGENSLNTPKKGESTMSSDEKEQKRISRREFVKGAAVGAAGVAAAGVLASCAQEATPCPTPEVIKETVEVPVEVIKEVELKPWLPDKWDKEADVVVVGAGGAGLCAAIEAADAGASVIVLEKTSSLLTSSTAVRGETKSPPSMKEPFEDFMKIGENVNDPELVRTYTDNALDTVNLLKSLGVKYEDPFTTPTAMVTILAEAAEAKGAQILLDTSAERLVVDYEDQVLGITSLGGGGKQFVKARKGVVICTGGFGRNPALLEQSRRGLSKVLPFCGLGHNGDGHNMAWSLGAGSRDMQYVMPTFGTHPQSAITGVRVNQTFYFSGAIIVNRGGKRFVNESYSYKLVGVAALGQTDGIGFQIFDQKIFDAANPRGATLELLVKADTIEELASKINVPPETLKDTLDKYNSYVDAGLDLEFGRIFFKEYDDPLKPIVKINTPPFYAFESMGVILGTYCGITINKDLQVINVYGEVIPRLYAAGEVVGGVHGVNYISGTAVGKALIFGRVAGKNAAALAPWA